MFLIKSLHHLLSVILISWIYHFKIVHAFENLRVSLCFYHATIHVYSSVSYGII